MEKQIRTVLVAALLLFIACSVRSQGNINYLVDTTVVTDSSCKHVRWVDSPRIAFTGPLSEWMIEHSATRESTMPPQQILGFASGKGEFPVVYWDGGLSLYLSDRNDLELGFYSDSGSKRYDLHSKEFYDSSSLAMRGDMIKLIRMLAYQLDSLQRIYWDQESRFWKLNECTQNLSRAADGFSVTKAQYARWERAIKQWQDFVFPKTISSSSFVISGQVTVHNSAVHPKKKK